MHNDIGLYKMRDNAPAANAIASPPGAIKSTNTINSRSRSTKLYAPFPLACFPTLTACGSAPIKGESSPCIEALFDEFSKCRADIFDHIAKSKSNYESLGPRGASGMWFNVKPLDSDTVEQIYRFEKPPKINGLTAVAAAYAFYTGDDAGYSGGIRRIRVSNLHKMQKRYKDGKRTERRITLRRQPQTVMRSPTTAARSR